MKENTYDINFSLVPNTKPHIMAIIATYTSHLGCDFRYHLAAKNTEMKSAIDLIVNSILVDNATVILF